ncbi:dihydroxyacetone kinase subunit DhaL [Phytomonospora sp. NPDC050363]|uniref:dihydroxyacetone kinase subunit DhaL n=1 Tax=Phytomonospora sp. NPDC050363 TaxID=3155642 RepID=UPI0033E9C77D
MTTVDAQLCAAWITGAAALVAEHERELTELDTAVGDGDHGLNLRRGFAAAATAVADAATPAAVLKAAGAALINSTGGASGPLYGTFLRRAGKALGDAETVGSGEFAAALAAGLDGVRVLGGAAEGDKTMIDALGPAVAVLGGGGDLATAAPAAYEAAVAGRDATASMVARKGRASYLGERSAGHVDPGAATTVLLFAALARAVGP